MNEALALVGDCRDLPLPDESVDAVVTDPPYGLAFMGKSWDHDVPGPEYWREVKRVMKPGAHLLAFGGTRTWHWLTVGLEDAGFEIRDCLSWMYGTGFPKSDALLKPCWEPIVLAWKDGGEGVVPLNIDGCRLGVGGQWSWDEPRDMGYHGGTDTGADYSGANSGRWPANVTLSHRPCCTEEQCCGACPVRQLDEQSGELSSGRLTPEQQEDGGFSGTVTAYGSAERGGTGYYEPNTGGASRFYYCSKASRREREAGLPGADGRANHHPTVKPLDLCRWLVRLVTRKGHTVLDPFMGSGSIGCAALQERRRYTGLDLEPEYVEIAKARLEHWAPKQVDMFKDRGAA